MNLKQELKRLWLDKRAQGDGASTLYMLIIIAIVALVLIAVIKPMFNSSMKTSMNVADLPNQGTTATPTVNSTAPTTGSS
ncbi:MAG TPA: hypothetical protein PLK55_01430 [archaeon]|nr:hypothetical protein [archaeon]